MTRMLHPLAWWGWSLGLAVAASRTTNPLLLLGLVLVLTTVVLARRSDGPWARAFRLYLVLAGVVVVVRVAFRVLFGGEQGGVVLLPLPQLVIPAGPAEVTLLGDVTAESLLAGFYDGLRLGVIILAVGAANTLVNPRRLLRTLPAALHEVSTALVVAVSVFPQLAESVTRVRAARRLRPVDADGRVERVRAVLVPVLEDALDRSLLLAASMDSRGYGRSAGRSPAASRLVGTLLVVGLAGVSVGLYAVLDTTTPRFLATPMLLTGVLVALVGVRLSGRGVRRTAYRPDAWRAAETLTVLCGAVTAVLVIAEDTVLYPSVSPPQWPALSLMTLAALAVGLLPAILTPLPQTVEAAPA